MLETITRDGATWMLTSPKAEHYSERWDNGHLFLHVNRMCCHIRQPVVVSPKIVRTLWEKDVAAGGTTGEHDVEWCTECAVQQVDG